MKHWTALALKRHRMPLVLAASKSNLRALLAVGNSGMVHLHEHQALGEHSVGTVLNLWKRKQLSHTIIPIAIIRSKTAGILDHPLLHDLHRILAWETKSQDCDICRTPRALLLFRDRRPSWRTRARRTLAKAPCNVSTTCQMPTNWGDTGGQGRPIRKRVKALGYACPRSFTACILRHRSQPPPESYLQRSRTQMPSVCFRRYNRRRRLAKYALSRSVQRYPSGRHQNTSSQFDVSPKSGCYEQCHTEAPALKNQSVRGRLDSG